MTRRAMIKCIAGLALSAAVSNAGAQPTAFPSKPVRIIAGSAPGALLDVAARLYADRMSQFLKQPVLVENMSGASSTVATRFVARAPADGYTLLGGANTIVTIPHLVKDAGYDTTRDFVGVGEMVRSPGILVVGGSSPYKSVADLVAAAKKSPDAIPYGSGGQGTTSHLPMEMFLRQAGIRMIHVPYKGVAPAVPDVISGRVAGLMGTATSFIGSMKAGQLRAIAITSDNRSPKFPDVPTFKELGYPGATFSIFVGLMAPAAIPQSARARLGDSMEAARADRAMRERLEAIDQEISDVRSPEQFHAFLIEEEAKYAKLIKEANIKAE